jgi:hypothetical protein
MTDGNGPYTLEQLLEMNARFVARSKLRSRLELRTLRQPSNNSRSAAARAVEPSRWAAEDLARTKQLGKVASQVAKPDGLVVVDAESELHFLHALPVGCPGC